MLNQKQINKIHEFIDQGLSDYKIHNETGHHITTIAKIRQRYEKLQQNQGMNTVPDDTSTIDVVRNAMNMLENHLQQKNLSEKERKKDEELHEKLGVTLRREVDEKIPREREEASQQLDKEWAQVIQQKYVQKDVAESLKKIITEKDATIRSLEDKAGLRAVEHEIDQTQIKNLLEKQQSYEMQLRDLTKQVVGLQNQRQKDENYIITLEAAIREPREQLQKSQEKLMTDGKNFEQYAEAQRKNLNAMFQEAERKRKDVETQENDVAKREEKLQKEQQNFEAAKEQWNKQYSDLTSSARDRVTNIVTTAIEDMVKKSFEPKQKEIQDQKRKILEEKKQLQQEWEKLKQFKEMQKIDR